jgi:hypothetical protein
MRIETIGESLKNTVQFGLVFPEKAAQQTVKTFTDASGKETVKTAPNGRPVHRTGLRALRLEDGQPVGYDKNVTLSVIEPSTTV